MLTLQQDWSARWAFYSPDKIAFKEFETGRTLSWSELHRLGNRLAHHLTNQFGLKKGDRIAILAENCLEFPLLFAAAQKTGCILVPLNYRLAGAEIDYLLRNARPGLVIGQSTFQVLLEAAPVYREVPSHWSVEELERFCDKNTRSAGDDHFDIRPVDENDPLFILYTSGTTGFPKGALYTYKMLFWNSVNTSLALIVNSESRTINCMPFFHTGGWNVLTTPLLHYGGYTCLIKKFDPAIVLKLLEQEKATLFMAVPTMLQMIAGQEEFEKADLSSLHYIIVGGEPMPIPLIEEWHRRGVPIRQGYGMTEVGPNLTSLHQRDAVRKKGSIGRPNFYVETKIVDDAGREVVADQAGELLLTDPMATPGYWENEEATKKAISEGWFHTGDLVRQDEEGYLFVVDRIKNMFISGGENVYPAEVERVIVSHPDVSEVVVIGVPDPKWGEAGRAFIVKREDSPLSTEDIRAYCRGRLAGFKIPKSVVFLDSLPKNDTGKLDRKALREI